MKFALLTVFFIVLSPAAAMGASPPRTGIVTNAGSNGPGLVGEGASLYAANCSSCHGPQGRGVATPTKGAGGVTGQGPPLVGVGALAADFYLRTGYMPLADPHAQPWRSRVLFDDREVRALVAYVNSLGSGPAIPHPQPGSIPAGRRLFSRPLCWLPPGGGEGRLRNGRARAGARGCYGDADRGGGQDRPVPDAAVLRASDHQRAVERSDRLCPVHRPPAQPGRVVDRRARPLAGGCRHLAARGNCARVGVHLAREEAHAMTKLTDWLISAIVLALGRKKKARRDERAAAASSPEGAPDSRAETCCSSSSSSRRLPRAAFIALYAINGVPHQTQWLGLALGLALALLAAASTVVAEAARRHRGARSTPTPSRNHRRHSKRSSRSSQRAARASRASGLSRSPEPGPLGTLGLALHSHQRCRSGPALDLDAL